jgi:hypothetical protein
MSKHHVVAITTQGYSLVSSHSTDGEAVDALASFRKSHRIACVLRDGSTGKRESVCEVEARIGRRI